MLTKELSFKDKVKCGALKTAQKQLSVGVLLVNSYKSFS
jgi:hypothetical protein